MVGGGGHGAVEVAKTVLEVAEVAWSAVECCHRHRRSPVPTDGERHHSPSLENELEALRSENTRLRAFLEESLETLDDRCRSSCPDSLRDQLFEKVNSYSFTDMEPLCKNRAGYSIRSSVGSQLQYPTAEASASNTHPEIPSSWIWVDDGAAEIRDVWSGIDDQNYVVVTEEDVVDGIAHFIAACIFLNPQAQNLTPQELQTAMSGALSEATKMEGLMKLWHVGKMVYAISTWGLALVGLYRSRRVLMLAARGVHTAGRAMMR